VLKLRTHIDNNTGDDQDIF